MFRALLFKEWRQLRGLRWAGFILGLLMPFVLIAGAEAGQRGWLPFGRISGYSVGSILVDAMWPLLLGLWALLALLFSSQAFAADRAGGTESFLIERPVPRSRIWSARWLASLCSTLLLVAAHAAYWTFLVRNFGDSRPPAQAGWLLAPASVALVVMLGNVAGSTAAAFVRSPIQSVLMGLVLGIIPLGLSTVLGGLFPYAGIGYVPIGMFLPALLLVGYVIAAHRMACAGEPAGRGRIRRGAVILTLFLLGVPVVFAITAPITMRVGAKGDYIQGPVAAAHGDRAALVLAGWPESAWFVDLEKKRLARFFPKPVYYAVWNPDGTRLAVIHAGHPLGRDLPTARLELLDAEGHSTGEPLHFDSDESFYLRPVWAGERLVVQSWTRNSEGLRIFSKDLQSFRDVPIEEAPGSWELIGPTADGSLYLYRLVSRDPNRFELNRIDTEHGTIDPKPLRTEEGARMGWPKTLSPSGRYWLRRVGERGDGVAEVVDLQTGAVFREERSLRDAWLSGDRWVRVVRVDDEKQLWVGVPGSEPAVHRSWRGQFVHLAPSPDRERLLVCTWGDPQGGTPGPGTMIGGQALRPEARLTGAWVFDPADASWTDVGGRLGMTPHYTSEHLDWAGTRTVALSGTGLFALIDLEQEQGIAYLIGRPAGE